MWRGLEMGEKRALPEKAIFRSVTVYYIYNIVVMMVHIEFMCRGLETGERRALQENLYLDQRQYITKIYPVNTI